jgi:hypothetical protein
MLEMFFGSKRFDNLKNIPLAVNDLGFFAIFFGQLLRCPLAARVLTASTQPGRVNNRVALLLRAIERKAVMP